MNPNPEIIYEDKEIIVCCKPAGMATQTKRIGQQDMESYLKNYRAKNKETPYIGVVHRLDQPVEGVMVFAKTPEVAGKLSEYIRNHSVGKHYYALGIKGTAKIKSTDTLIDYIVTDKKNNVSKIVSENDKAAKKAKLQYNIVEETADLVCFDIELYTGRQHQIRVQLANLGCPLCGDKKYGDKSDGYRQLALCSYKLEFEHPITGKMLEYKIKPQNKAFENFIDK